MKNRNHNNVPHPINSKYNGTSDKSQSRDSQDFKLRISDSFYTNDEDEEDTASILDFKNRGRRLEKASDIIVISDSSDDDSPILRKGHRPNNNNKRDSSIGLESIEVSDEDDDIFTGSLTRKPSSDSSKTKSMSSGSHNTSDETNFSLKISKNDDESESVVDSSYTTPISKLKVTKPQNDSYISEKIMKPPEILRETPKKFATPGTPKLSQCTTPLSKREVKNIMKVIKSKRIESPVVTQQNHIIDETDSDSVVSDNEPNGKVVHPAWIDDSDAESSTLPKPIKTHVTRFLNPPDSTSDIPLLADEKQKEISRWILNNSPADRSDDSLSNISASNRNSSISSGHRSLEQLEVNYETPNNRQKFRERSVTKSSTNVQNVSKSPRGSQTPVQTSMDDFLRKTKSNTKSNTKPKTYIPIAIKSKTVAVSPAVDSPDPKLEDCADILDKLYGSTWRQANVLPTSEPRKPVQLRDRGVQTDCIRKPKKSSSDQSSNDGSYRRFIKDLPPDSTKKINKKYEYRDSFIVHSSESEESTGDTTFMTALTNPRISDQKAIEKRDTPMTLNTRKAIEICDSDSDDVTPKNQDNRRKLVFSDDDNDHSTATSEYDPEDYVPVKPVLPKPVRPLSRSKIPTRTPLPKQFQPAKQKSFIASLSTSIPLENCHQDAKRYRLNYKNTKEELVKVLYKMYNDQIFENKLPPDMLIEWNVRMRGTAGFCYNKKTVGVNGVRRSSRIELATKVCDKAERVRDTLVHEMCHAAAWLINEVADGHGPFWKTWAMKAMRAFPELPAIKRCHDYEIHTKFTYKCVQCGYR